MGGPSKERVWGATIRQAEERARATRHAADVAACDAWNYRMEGYGGPARPSPPIGDALNAGFRYLEIKCAGCNMHSTVDLSTLRRPRETLIWQLERRMRCRQCSEIRGYPYKARAPGPASPNEHHHPGSGSLVPRQRARPPLNSPTNTTQQLISCHDCGSLVPAADGGDVSPELLEAYVEMFQKPENRKVGSALKQSIQQGLWSPTDATDYMERFIAFASGTGRGVG